MKEVFVYEVVSSFSFSPFCTFSISFNMNWRGSSGFSKAILDVKFCIKRCETQYKRTSGAYGQRFRASKPLLPWLHCTAHLEDLDDAVLLQVAYGARVRIFHALAQ